MSKNYIDLESPSYSHYEACKDSIEQALNALHRYMCKKGMKMDSYGHNMDEDMHTLAMCLSYASEQIQYLSEE